MDEILEHYVDLVMEISLAFKMNKIDKDAYIANLKVLVDFIEKNFKNDN